MNIAVDPALLRTDESKGSTRSSLINYAKRVPTTTTPVYTQHPQPANPAKRQRSQPMVSKMPSMATFAERILNEFSKLIAETHSSKRTRLAEDQQASNQNISSNPTSHPVPVADQFQPYREALALLMAMHKKGKLSVNEITEAIDWLEICQFAVLLSLGSRRRFVRVG